MSLKSLCTPLPRLLQRACLPRSRPSLRVRSLSLRFLPLVPSSYPTWLLSGIRDEMGNDLRAIDCRVKG